MKARCNNPNETFYHLYGGRGIKVCDRWQKSFWHFVEDVGAKPVGKTMDRIDNDGDYEPKNIRWATPREQGLNRRIPKNPWGFKGVSKRGTRENAKYRSQIKVDGKVYSFGDYSTAEEAHEAYVLGKKRFEDI